MKQTQNAAARGKQLAEYHLPRWNELPDIELYMDQVIGQLDKYFSVLNETEEHFVTTSMINNYVKLGLLPAPVKKKYGRAHLAHLVVVCLLKQTLSIPEIKLLLEASLGDAGDGLSAVYDAFCEVQERAYAEIAARAQAPEALSAPASALAVELAVFAGAAKAVAQSLLTVQT